MKTSSRPYIRRVSRGPVARPHVMPRPPSHGSLLQRRAAMLKRRKLSQDRSFLAHKKAMALKAQLRARQQRARLTARRPENTRPKAVSPRVASLPRPAPIKKAPPKPAPPKKASPKPAPPTTASQNEPSVPTPPPQPETAKAPVTQGMTRNQKIMIGAGLAAAVGAVVLLRN